LSWVSINIHKMAERTEKDNGYIAVGLVATMENLSEACTGLIANGHTKIARSVVDKMKGVREDMKLYGTRGVSMSGDYMGKNNLDIHEYAEKIKGMEETQ